jgi:serine/threonine-protein kinase
MIERHLVLTAFSLASLDDEAARGVREAFFAEMRRVGLLAHAGIAALFDAGETPDGVFFATEFVEGVSLADQFEAGVPLSLPERVSIAVQLADALEYAGGQGVPHLHLKPTNILIAADGSPRIRGFGVAGVQHALAPERGSAASRDMRADVFGLAGVVEALLAVDGAAADAATDEVIRKARSAEPADRFSTPASFKYALLLALGMDEFDVKSVWESTREATTVHAADTSSLADLPHSAVNPDLTRLEAPTYLTPSGVEELTKLQPLESVREEKDPA